MSDHAIVPFGSQENSGDGLTLPPIRYSRFYDGTDETQQALIAGVGISEEDAEWYSVPNPCPSCSGLSGLCRFQCPA